MKHQINATLAILGLFATITTGGCGGVVGGEGEGEGEGESGSSDPTDPTDPTNPTDTTPTATCFFEGVEYQPGDEFESSDGCATYRCDSGVSTVIEDGFVIVQGDLALATQADVAAQECLREVTGKLTISGTTSDVSSLASLYRVGGDLEIRASALTTLVGLGGLAEIGGSLIVADNASLTMLAFPQYMSVFGDATIQNNDALASLAGAEFLGSCSGCIHAPPMGLGEDTGSNEPSPGGDEGSGLTAGDEAPEGGTFYGNILIADNDVLVDIYALSNLWFAWADVRLRGNLALADISAIGQLSQVRGTLEISGHPTLDDATVQAIALAIDVWGTRIVCGNGAGAAC